jgi:transposase-like protein
MENMKRENKYGLGSLRRDFPTDQACLQFAFDTLHSKECACGGRNTLMSTRKQFYCTRCRKQTAVLVGTIFERSVVSLSQWFRSILLVHQGISIKGLQRELGTTYKTAWRCSHILRNAMRGDTIDIICPKKTTELGIKKTRKKL